MSVEDHVTPVRDQVLVRTAPRPGEVGSIILPASAEKASHSRGTVLAAGPLARLLPGQEVIYRTNTPMALGLDEERGEPIGILAERECLAVVRGDDVAAS